MNHSACPDAGRFCLLIIVIFPPLFAVEGASNRQTDNSTVITARALKGLDFDGWGAEIVARDTLPGSGTAALNERLEVRLQRLPGYHRQWKVDHSLHFSFDHPLSLSSALVGALTQQEYRNQSARRYQTGRKINLPYTT